MTLTKSEVERIVNLARIKLTSKEKDKMAEDLGRVLDYINKLNEVNTEGVEPMAQVTGFENVFRVDEPREATSRENIIEQFPQKKEDYLKVKAIFENKE